MLRLNAQLPRHGALRVKQTARTDAYDFGAKPSRSAPMFISLYCIKFCHSKFGMGRVSSEARINDFLFIYRIALSAFCPHEPSTYTTQNSRDGPNHRQGTGLTWSQQWRDSRSGCSSGLCFRLKYSQSESPHTTNPHSSRHT